MEKIEISNYSKQDFTRSILLSLKNKDFISIEQSLESGQNSDGCLVCCSAPSCLPLLGVFPCFRNPDYIIAKHESSKYVYLREHSIEWNNPEIILADGNCCGVDPCLYTIRDNVQVIYFDDPILNHVSDQTRTCHELRTCLCGGQGELIQMDSRCCWGFAYKTYISCLCVPLCCPSFCCPCILRKEIYVRDAQKGIFEISKALKKFHQQTNNL